MLDGPLETNKPAKFQQVFGTTTAELRDAVDWLVELKVTDVFMESTGQYWVPVFNIFAESDLQLNLANPAHIKNVPGRKTDVKDAEWIAQSVSRKPNWTLSVASYDRIVPSGSGAYVT